MDKEDNTQIDRELRDNEIVHQSWTNYPIESILNNEILLDRHNNYIKLIQVVPEELVHQVLTIYGRSVEASRVIAYILDHPAFLVPTIRHVLAINKQTIYTIVNDLSPWIIKTDKTIEHPGRSPGPRAHVWIVEGQDLIEGVKEARRSLYEILSLTDPYVKRLEIQKRQLIEATTIIKTYMDERGLKTIPDSIIIVPILKESGLKAINLERLTNSLFKEGYNW